MGARLNPSVSQSWEIVTRWLECNPTAQTLPGHIQQHVDIIERHHITEGKQQQDLFGFDYSDAEHVRELVAGELHERAARRDAEARLADYIEDVSLLSNRDDLAAIVPRLRACRQSGSIGMLPDGGHVIYWDYKCGLARLCPDESREETQRLTDFYLPEMMDFIKKSPTHRIFYAVLTTHNHRPGDLARGKAEQFKKLKSLLGGIEYCPVMFEDGPACKLNQVAQGKEKLFKNIQGALVVQEDPLSSSSDWNVHLNVFFLVRGAFNYAEIRQAWGANVHFQQVQGDEGAIRKSLLEAIKYSARTVPEKSEEKANVDRFTKKSNGANKANEDGGDCRNCQNGQRLQPGHVGDSLDATGNDGRTDSRTCCTNPRDTYAPSMIEWPAERFCEWWDAQQGFRRTRAYGVLYAAHSKRWNREVTTWRQQVCWDAEFTEIEIQQYVRCTWKDIGKDLDKKAREKLKARLRHAMVYGEKIDYRGVKWIGSVNFSPGGSYSVDLIPEDNFSRDPRRNDNFFSTGPP